MRSEAAIDAVAIREGWTLPPRLGLGTRLWRVARRKPLGTFGALAIAILAAFAVGAPVIGRYDPSETFSRANPSYQEGVFNPQALRATTTDSNSPPSAGHWLGTDNAGRDIWSRVVWGARRSLSIGVGALSLSLVIGSVAGIVSAYFSGWVDTVMQRFIDSLQAFPALLLLILIATFMEPNIRNLMLALGVVGIPQVSRIVRGTVLSLREMPYVEAARVLGAGDFRIMAWHILPNALAPIIVVFTIGLGSVIIAEASLSFLRMAPPGISWGQMLDEGRQFVTSSPWQALFSGLAISVAVLGFNLAGDALRDVLDPRLRI